MARQLLLKREATQQGAIQQKNKGIRELGSIRAMEGDGNERRFILSFSSEEPYTRWFGPEILDHTDGCVDLDRLNSIGCLLFNHKRDSVVGKITKAWIENGRGQAEVEFDDDEASEVIYQKVKSGTLKGVSVGYMVDSWEEVMPGKQSADGRFTGPCSIARKWAPYEISIVSVPADPTVGVGRSEGEGAERVSLEMYERQLQINKNLMEEGTDDNQRND
jgi:caudovirus prohead protease|nr:MAG TPA: major capsid protein [Caudoviricetes sp.]